ncbi:hypothetical protein ACH0AH_04140 [Microbacterium paludicola]|uniref:Uncharacterized protein n=1 Tax=Microbacterium paludicola TaxID=300019 RepID=A0A4Y9FSK8_9MICO|nr:hypothetical protein [Microbacterium paludicola]MBF0817041.1 hypothetical protein [Microbacterium paludicola]TFU32236.1 hypothetical protein E4U02_11500 [Microbacterium paludicola]
MTAPEYPPPPAAWNAPAAQPASRGVASLVAAGFAAGVVLLGFVAVFVLAAAISSGDPTTVGLSSLPTQLASALLGIGAIVAGSIGMASRARFVLAGVSVGVGLVPVISGFVTILEFMIHAATSVL